MNDVIYDEVKIKIRKGDTLTSKKGLIFKSVLLEKNYLVHIVEYLGDGGWLMPDGKEVIQEERVN